MTLDPRFDPPTSPVIEPEQQALLRRIEQGRPEGYWEENLVLGRRSAFGQLLDWMQPLETRRVLEIGAIESERASLAAQCVGVESFNPSRRDAEPIDDVVLWEVLERLATSRRGELLETLEARAPSRLFVAVRVISTWGRLVPALASSLPTGDPIEILRAIHLATDLRLSRQETLQRRNSSLHLIELRRPDAV